MLYYSICLNILTLQTEWDSFLGEIDNQLKGDQSTSRLTVGSQGPCDMQLIDARTERLV